MLEPCARQYKQQQNGIRHKVKKSDSPASASAEHDRRGGIFHEIIKA